MNIVYSSSDQYAECTGVSLYSLLKTNTDSKELNIYILSTDISFVNQQKLIEIATRYNRNIKIIDAKSDFISMAQTFNLPLMRGAYNTYSRIMLNTWFDDLDKVLVIDSDTMICGDVQPLYNTDMNGMLIGAVPEIAVYTKIGGIEDRDLLSEVPTYYNMGICLVNLKEWRDRNIDDYLRNCIRNHDGEFKIADQSIINKFLNPWIRKIPLKYNFYSVVHRVKYTTINKIFEKRVISEEEFNDATDNPIIIHYFGHSYERPWFRYNIAYLKKDYMKNWSQTPWSKCKRQKWRKSGGFVLRVYDIICYSLLKMHMYNFCLKFRYIYGQRVKKKTNISRK